MAMGKKPSADGNGRCGWRRRNCLGVRGILSTSAESGAGESGVRRCRRGLCARFYADGPAPESAARTVLPDAVGGVLRRAELGTGHRLASGGFDERAGFSGLGSGGDAPNHSTLSRTRRRIDVETHGEVFRWVLGQLAEAGLVRGKTIGIDATTLEANAAMRSLVRRDTGEDYERFVRGLAEASGVPTPTRKELVRFDRKRKKKTSNREWVNPHDPEAKITKPEAKITKLKDGRTRLGHKVEEAVDLETGAVVAVTVPEELGDPQTMGGTLGMAREEVKAVGSGAEVWEVVADKGYHSNETVLELKELGLRGYLSETDRGRRNWKGKNRKYQAPVYANRRRIRGGGGDGCSDGGASWWSDRSRTSSAREGCVGSSSGATPTCASDC